MTFDEAARELKDADDVLTLAVTADKERWGWAFDEMTDEQGEALNRFFTAVANLLIALNWAKPWEP